MECEPWCQACGNCWVDATEAIERVRELCEQYLTVEEMNWNESFKLGLETAAKHVLYELDREIGRSEAEKNEAYDALMAWDMVDEKLCKNMNGIGCMKDCWCEK